MVFSELSAGLQKIIIQQYYLFGKGFLFLFFFGFSLIYLLFWKPYFEKPTPLFTVGFIRIYFTMLSFAYLTSAPLIFILINPEFPFWTFYAFMNVLYFTGVFILLITFVIDVFRFGIPIMMKLGGINIKDPEAQKVFRKLFKRGNYNG